MKEQQQSPQCSLQRALQSGPSVRSFLLLMWPESLTKGSVEGWLPDSNPWKGREAKPSLDSFVMSLSNILNHLTEFFLCCDDKTQHLQSWRHPGSEATGWLFRIQSCKLLQTHVWGTFCYCVLIISFDCAYWLLLQLFPCRICYECSAVNNKSPS